MADKKELRASVRASIAALPQEYIESSNKGIFSTISSMSEFVKAPRIFAYLSVGNEVSTRDIIELAIELGKTVALPVVYKHGRMEFAEFNDYDALKGGSLGIPEPSEDAKRLVPAEGDIVLVPALCFDKDSYRLGQGGGYYDRFLSACQGYSVGLCRHQLLVDEVPREIHDLPTQCLISEQGIVKCYKRRNTAHSHGPDDGGCSCGCHGE